MSNLSSDFNDLLKRAPKTSKYDLLFCDQLELYEKRFNTTRHPWDLIFSTMPDQDELSQILCNPNFDARIRLLAAKKLRLLNCTSVANQLLAVVIETNFAEGMEVFAAYKNTCGLFVRKTGKILFQSTAADECLDLLNIIFQKSDSFLQEHGLENIFRNSQTRLGSSRISFLTIQGICAIEAPIIEFCINSDYKDLVESIFSLMNFIIETHLDLKI
ncbi:hypothetical protein [Dyadobacter aurulentus]|uniref:hypothetical protein n=1 Tax=Dyadobacter sp. UC 10 TaxID=2605428 RepID=UPI0011F27D0C|nr:hypothetical protein [Dyadobacter sp. UC 10]KAA0992929.1 hypothetical protein FXO21_23545 [Dyadobacter sp. UC 10]